MEDNTIEFEIHPQVKYLLELPQYEQRSKEWFDQRKDKLTSSDVDTVLGNNKYSKPDEVLFKKCGIAKPFTGNIATRHGQKYEDEAIEHYCRLYNKKSYSFGLLPHPNVSWLGGSPDDITHDGIVIEVKCPFRRKIVMGEVPKHYIGQIKMNMEIADLDKAVFIEYLPASMNKENPDEMILNIVELERDREWFNNTLPILEKFWNDVVYYRENGISNHSKYDYYLKRSKPKEKKKKIESSRFRESDQETETDQETDQETEKDSD